MIIGPGDVEIFSLRVAVSCWARAPLQRAKATEWPGLTKYPTGSTNESTGVRIPPYTAVSCTVVPLRPHSVQLLRFAGAAKLNYCSTCMHKVGSVPKVALHARSPKFDTSECGWN